MLGLTSSLSVSLQCLNPPTQRDTPARRWKRLVFGQLTRAFWRLMRVSGVHSTGGKHVSEGKQKHT